VSSREASRKASREASRALNKGNFLHLCKIPVGGHLALLQWARGNNSRETPNDRRFRPGQPPGAQARTLRTHPNPAHAPEPCACARTLRTRPNPAHTATAPAHPATGTQAPAPTHPAHGVRRAPGRVNHVRTHARSRACKHAQTCVRALGPTSLTLGRLGRAPTAAARGGRLPLRTCRSPRPTGRAGSGSAPTAAARGDRLWPRPRRSPRPMELVGSRRAPTAAARGDRLRPRPRRSPRPMELVGPVYFCRHCTAPPPFTPPRLPLGLRLRLLSPPHCRHALWLGVPRVW